MYGQFDVIWCVRVLAGDLVLEDSCRAEEGFPAAPEAAPGAEPVTLGYLNVATAVRRSRTYRHARTTNFRYKRW